MEGGTISGVGGRGRGCVRFCFWRREGGHNSTLMVLKTLPSKSLLVNRRVQIVHADILFHHLLGNYSEPIIR